MFWFYQIVDTLKREHIGANAYKRQVSLNEMVIVDGHDCHTALKLGVMAKENQGKLSTLYWLPKLHNRPIKQDVLPILVLVRQQNFLIVTSCLAAIKTTNQALRKKYMKDLLRICFGP